VLALLHSRQLLDYDERVATYWPEFAQAGKEDITVRQLLAHQAGLFAFDERVDAEVVADLDRLAGVMERQRPIWPPGERQAYHAITLGFYENELVRRIDPATGPSASYSTRTSPSRSKSLARCTSGHRHPCPTIGLPPLSHRACGPASRRCRPAS
jgi:hypothetical protein